MKTFIFTILCAALFATPVVAQTAMRGERIGRAFSSTLKTPVTGQTFRLNILESAGQPQIDEMKLDVDQ